MPELPEVETIRKQLAGSIVRKKIARVTVRYPKVVHGMLPDAFERTLRGKAIVGIGRQGKLIFVRIAGGKTLVVHLKMTGRLLLVKYDAQPNKSTEVVFVFGDGTGLHYDDLRRFGYMKILPSAEEGRVVQKEQLGLDFFDRAMTAKKFRELVRSRNGSQIKPLLMDQSLIAGIGNIYAQEACFAAKIHPERKVSTLADRELDALFRALGRIMRTAITHRGSSNVDYLDAFGKKGTFAPLQKVYDRVGEPCVRCKVKLVKKTVGGRGTTFCPNCQKSV